MTFRPTIRMMCAAAIIGGVAFASTANAQQRPPSASALALAKELIEIKGATKVYDPVVTGVIEYHKNLLIQSNPNLSKDLNEVAQKLHAEMAPRRAELQLEVVRIYAQHFTEQELKDVLAFYKTPVGRKLVTEEPKVLEDTMKRADQWSAKFAEEIMAKMRAEMKKKGHNVI